LPSAFENTDPKIVGSIFSVIKIVTKKEATGLLLPLDIGS